MKECEKELRDTIAAIMKSHPLWGTKFVLAETARQLITRPGWTAGGVPSSRHAWPAYLDYSPGPGQGGKSWDRGALGWVIGEVRGLKDS